MSFFSNLFGGTFESNKADGESLFDEGAFGEARMAFERALKKGKGISGDELEAIKSKMAECRLRLARQRMEEARTLTEHGSTDEAREILEDIPHLCEDPAVLEEAAEQLKSLDAEEARIMASDAQEMTEEELLAVIAGTWSEAQADEYASLPDEFRDALLADHDGDHETAAALLATVIEGAKSAGTYDDLLYIHLELAKSFLAAGKEGEAVEACDRFLELSEGKSHAQDARTSTRTRLARVFFDRGEQDRAKEHLIHATREQPEDHRPFLNLGVLLREMEQHEESLVALEKATELMGQMRPDFTVIREKGLTYLAMGKEKEAEENLNAVVEHQASKGEHDQIDPVAAMHLAALREKSGRLEDAADIFRHLAVGHDIRNHFFHNFQAARLLFLTGKGDLADRYLTRARELAGSEDQLEQVEKLEAKIKE